MKVKPSSNKPAPLDFEATLRAALKSGRWKPGDRLPTTVELVAESGCDLRTVQRTLATLAAQGLLDRRPRLGTFVRETPAPLTIGLATGWNLKLERNVFPRRFAHEMERSLTARGYRMHLFDDLFAMMVNDEASFQSGLTHLRERMEAVNPAGFVELQIHLSRLSSLMQEWQKPTVHAARLEYGADLSFDRDAFYHDALEWLAQQGCRRVTLIRKGLLLEHFPTEDNAFYSATRKHRFLRASIREVFVREQNPDMEGGAARLTETLVDSWATARRTEIPDALLLTDDVMMRGVVTALMRRGITEHPTLLTLGTAGMPYHYALPVHRYELPLPALTDALAQRLHLKLSRQPIPKGPVLFRGQMVSPEQPAIPDIVAPSPISNL